MKCYIYDGSFDGLLTAIYEAYYRREIPENILLEADYQENFFSERVVINTDLEKSERVYKSIKNKISNSALKNIFYVFLSELRDAGTYIYKYLKLGWKTGPQIDLMLTNNDVQTIQKIREKVSRERHFLLGLLRFRKLQGNVYYAPLEPEYNVVGLIAPHFAQRMADQNWIIHDVKRSIGAVYNKEEWIMREIALDKKLILSDDELEYQKLWNQYFESIAIKDRINPRLQRSNMPMKYWKYLIEKN